MTIAADVKPKSRVVTMPDGMVIQAVNWFDFEGWEVRIASSPELGINAGPLGFIYEFEDRFDNKFWNASTQPKMSDDKGRSFATFKGAVSYLIVQKGAVK